MIERFRRLALLVAAIALGSLTPTSTWAQAPAAAKAAPTAEQIRFFESKIRPVLVEKCLKCHGPEKQKGALRLDSKAELLKGGDTGPVVDFAKPDESLLAVAVKYDEDGPKMPPNGKLTAPQIEAILAWIKMGTPWPGDDGKAVPAAASAAKKHEITDKDRAHWAFQPIKRPAVPKVEGASTSNPIDAFILAGLKAKGLSPNPPATKIELIRRATYDLTGLPPTPQEVDDFLADTRADAYPRLIDRLLRSPRYGEKWARYWLDLVRFAETNSYERDNPKPSAWRYRDYVIKSLNEDKPYDRFVKEQLAGDELAGANSESITATGFYRLGIWDDEPVDREQARFDMLDDIVATTGQVFLGLTVDCARCHDHKLDPIPQKDYYKLVSFFRNINHFRNGGPTDEYVLPDEDRTERGTREMKEIEAKRQAALATIAGLEDEFIRRVEAQAKTSEAGKNRASISRRDIDELTFKFYRDTWDHLPDFAGIKYEDTGELPRGLFSLTPRTRDQAFGFVFEGWLNVPDDGEYTFHLDSDDGARLLMGEKEVVAYDGLHKLGREKSGKATLKAGRAPIRLEYFQKSDTFGLSVAWSGPDFSRRSLSAETAEPKRVDVRTAIRERGVNVLGNERWDRYQQARRFLNDLKNRRTLQETALCVTEAGPSAPDTFVLLRGNPHVPGDKIAPGFLTVLGEPEPQIPAPSQGGKTTGRRKVLADWIASPRNPLTARVMANRVFQYHFGRGIVRSPNNFGLQGDKPTHPELLDWLASELIDGGWRLKSLHKLIMTSNAYQMSSQSKQIALAKDPVNDSLWRFDMRRLTAEEIRDSILAVDGRLNLKMGGPGIYPEIPEEVMAGQSVPGKGWGHSSREEAARRSVYIHVKRSLLVPILEGFDLAETDRSTPVRFSSTQPTQALGMLNSKFLNEESVAFATRLKREAGAKTDDQVRLALKLVTSREPSPAEIKRGVGLIDALQARDGESPDQALASFCLIALNLNEFVYLD